MNTDRNLSHAPGTQTLTGLFSVLLVIAPPLCFFLSKAMAPVAVAAAVFGLVAVRGRLKFRDVFAGTPVKLALAIVVLIILSTTWALSTSQAINGSLKLTGNIIVGLVLFALAMQLEEQQRQRVRLAAGAGLAVLVSMLAIEWLFSGPIYYAMRGVVYRTEDSGPFWLNNGATLALLMVWPCILSIRSGWVWRALALVAVVVVIWQIEFRSGALAGATGCGVALLVWALRRKFAVVMGAIVGILILVAPLLPGTILKTDFALEHIATQFPSIAHRFQIWTFTAGHIAEKPMLGWGMNASRVLPGGSDTATTNVFGIPWENLPLHPHNGTLQIWLELGLVGAVIWCLLWIWLLIAVSARVPHRGPLLAIYMGYMTTLLVLLNLSYGLWQSWWIGAIWLTGMLFTGIGGNFVRTRDGASTQ